MENNEIRISADGIDVEEPGGDVAQEYFHENLSDAITNHLTQGMMMEESDAEAMMSKLSATMTFDFNEQYESEPIEEDRFDPGSDHGHYTETVGESHSVSLDLGLTFTDPDLVIALGIGKDEMTLLLHEALEATYGSAVADHSVDIDMGFDVDIILCTIEEERKDAFENSYVVIPKALSGILTKEDCMGSPIPSNKEIMIYSAPNFTLPLYHADLGDFLPDNLQAIMVKDARELLSNHTLGIDDLRDAMRSPKPEGFPSYKTGALRFVEIATEALSKNQHKHDITQYLGRSVAANATSPEDALLLIAKVVDSTVRLRQVTWPTKATEGSLNDILDTPASDRLDAMLSSLRNDVEKATPLVSTMLNAAMENLEPVLQDVLKTLKDSPSTQHDAQPDNITRPSITR
jgi:hypothetical protein